MNYSEFIYRWQSLLGAFFGASTPFLLWWFAEKYREGKENKNGLYLLERHFVDQIDTLLETRDTLEKFIVTKLGVVIQSMSKDESDIYSVDMAFFPLFSTRPLAGEIHNINTGSGYLDNKIGRVYKLSMDMPYIIDDVRRQFEHTLQLNREIAFAKANPANVQRKLLLENLRSYIAMIKGDLLEKNIPVYLKLLVEARIGLDELRNVGMLRWRMRFDLKYRFYWSQADYLAAKNSAFENMEKYFKKKVDASLQEIEINSRRA